ncbi:MAG TPA: hypothetical protein VF733_03320 [Candidatus Saccharimonadales bacterium]
MRLNSQYTAPDQRFFFPDNHGVEYHESLDTTNLPGVEHIPGLNHYVVSRDALGEVRGDRLDQFGDYNLEVNDTILGVKGQTIEVEYPVKDMRIGQEILESFDEQPYMPPQDEGVLAIVQAHISGPKGVNAFPNDRFDQDRVGVLPHGEPLLGFGEIGVPDGWVRFRLLGFIAANDKLVTWSSETSYTALLVDYSVATHLRQNRLEERLLFNTLPRGGSLVGMLDVNHASKAYLNYFDAKRNTDFMPRNDPRYPYEESRFAQLTPEELVRYHGLVDIARFYGENNRSINPERLPE